MEIGNKVRTTDAWNAYGKPISGTIIGFETRKYPRTIKAQNPHTGYISELIVQGQWGHTEVVVLDNGEKLHESNLEIWE